MVNKIRLIKPGNFRGLILLFMALILNSHSIGAIELFYKYQVGDRYRIISTVLQDIYVDRRLSYKAEIINRISMEITGITGDRARFNATFQSAEKTHAVGVSSRDVQAALFLWSRDYKSEFDQDRFGKMFVSDQYYKPMVRNVPVFPDRNLNPGDTWSADGLEVHDFRDNFGIELPYLIPFTANYTFLGERTWKGTSYTAFSVSYRIFLEPSRVPGKVYPRRILGASDQIIYWDLDRGQATAYEEHYRTIIDLSNGQTWEYRGRAEAEVIEAPPLNKEEIAKEIAEGLSDIPDTSVRVSEEGIVISLEDIQFAPDSAVLRPGERPKLDRIGEILARYPERDILVGGHTALAGTAGGRLQLSLERAQAVADYLLNNKVRTADRVVIRGYGAELPVADNRTEEGMRKNRRVEITILEN